MTQRHTCTTKKLKKTGSMNVVEFMIVLLEQIRFLWIG